MENVVVYDVWFKITFFVTEIRKYTAAMGAIGKFDDNMLGNKQNAYFELSITAVNHLLITEIAKLFDNESTCGHENCSIKRLKELCLKDENVAIFPEDDVKNPIKLIDKLYEKYETVISKKTPDEKIAHHDLSALSSNRIDYILFESIRELVEETSDLIIRIGVRLLCCELKFTPLLELTDKYEEAIKALIDKPNNDNDKM